MKQIFSWSEWFPITQIDCIRRMTPDLLNTILRVHVKLNFKILVRCISEMSNQDITSIITLRNPDETSFSCPVVDQASFEIALTMLAERVVWLDNSVRVSSSRLERCCLFIISVYAPTDCSPHEAKDQFYREVPQLFHSVLNES